MDENKILDMLEKIYAEVQSHSKRLDNVDTKLKDVDNRLDTTYNEVKNSFIKLESLESKIQTLSEIQKSYIEQNDKKHIEIIIPIKETTDVIELAVKNTSKDIQELSDKFDKVEKVTIQNTYDVAYLKSVK